MTTAPDLREIFVTNALKSWETWIGLTSKFFDSITGDEMLREIAPGKNRPIYLLGHLVTVNDYMIPQLRLGEPSHADLRESFLVQPDRAVADLPAGSELREHWKDLNTRLNSLFAELSPAQWLERHALVSEEDFAKEPHRNRLSILHSRTGHIAYHLGQLRLLPKQTPGS